jgi:hypothetical protein
MREKYHDNTQTQTGRQTDRKADRQTDRRTNIDAQANKLIHARAHTHTHGNADTLMMIARKKYMGVDVPIYHFKQPDRLNPKQLPFRCVNV